MMKLSPTKILVLLNLFFLQSYLWRFPIGSYPSNMQEVLIGATGITFLFEAIREKKVAKTIKSIKKHWIITTFILLTALSLLTVPIENNVDFLRHIKFLFFALVFAFIFIETFKTTTERKFAIKIAGYGAILFGIFSLIYNLLGYNVAYDLRLLGPLDAAVYLAYYLAPFFIFFMIESIENRKTKDIVAAIILGLLIIATRSMGAIGGTFVVLLGYTLTQSDLKILKKKSIKIILTLTAILILGAIFYTKILPTIQTNYSSLDERGEIWKTAIHLFKEPKNLIWGLGFGQFEHKYIGAVDSVLGHAPLDYYVIQPHNIFLLFISQYGLLGLIFLIAIIWRTLKSENTVFKYMLIYFFVHGLIDTPFFKNDILILLIILMECVLERGNKLARKDARVFPSEKNSA